MTSLSLFHLFLLSAVKQFQFCSLHSADPGLDVFPMHFSKLSTNLATVLGRNCSENIPGTFSIFRYDYVMRFIQLRFYSKSFTIV